MEWIGFLLWFNSALPLILLGWLCLSAALHAVEENIGWLWQYLGHLTGNGWATSLPPERGTWIFIIPAFLGQATVASLALLPWVVGADGPDHFWLSLAVGLRAGDATFTHVTLWCAAPQEWNPGIGTAIIYVIESLVLGVLFAPLDYGVTLAGIYVFLVPIVVLRLTDRRVAKR